MQRITSNFILALTGLLLIVFPFAAKAKSELPAPLQNLPQVVDTALRTFHTPGMAIGIIKDNRVVYVAGHGLRDVERNLPVTADTYFRLASVSKAFTAASLGILVDDKKLDWQDPVIRYLPQFQMADAWVTREFTLTDLLTHRSGLGSGAGDSMLWPEPSGFSRQEIVHNLRYLTPQHSFRSHYAYSNVMYITAAEVVSQVAGMPWETFVEKRLFGPLGMPCFAGDVPEQALQNSAISYGYNEERGLYAIPRNQIAAKGLVSAAAGGITCNAPAMLNWLKMWLNNGALPNDKTLLSEATVEKMTSPHTLLAVSETDEVWDSTLFSAYGLGWRVKDVMGRKLISHTGTLSGYQTYVAMVPSLNLGIVLLNNGSDYGARGAVMQTILKAYLPESAAPVDWVSAYQLYQKKQEEEYLQEREIPQGSGKVLLPLKQYSGEFEDAWFGKITVSENKNQLRVKAQKMPTLTGSLEPFEDHTFVIRWDNQNAADDAFIHFSRAVSGDITGFSLYPFTAKVKQNHAWRDMFFVKLPTSTPPG